MAAAWCSLGLACWWCEVVGARGAILVCCTLVQSPSTVVTMVAESKAAHSGLSACWRSVRRRLSALLRLAAIRACCSALRLPVWGEFGETAASVFGDNGGWEPARFWRLSKLSVLESSRLLGLAVALLGGEDSQSSAAARPGRRGCIAAQASVRARRGTARAARLFGD